MAFSWIFDLVHVVAVNNTKLLYTNLCCIKRPKVNDTFSKHNDIVVDKVCQRLEKNGDFWMSLVIYIYIYQGWCQFK